ncbi:MAG: ADP-ribosylglycohydrolase family protein [Armatimonas sp.]
MVDKYRGCLYGAAFGDCLGGPVEFVRTVWEIRQRVDDDGPRLPVHGRVTDDTQMMLYVGEALVQAGPPYTPERLEAPLVNAFVRWLNDPDNTRAPGRTCISACMALSRGFPWRESTIRGSKGCGANMRVQPVGLLKADDETIGGVAQFQAALTHGHSTGLAAAELTAIAIARLIEGMDPLKLPAYLREYAESQRHIYREKWLGDLWDRAGFPYKRAFAERGWEECLAVLARLDNALQEPEHRRDLGVDPCEATGDGWIAEEAFATGLLCFLLYPNEPLKALHRATLTSGDTDSIACLTGAFAGASCGAGAFPQEWFERIEYAGRLEGVIGALTPSGA